MGGHIAIEFVDKAFTCLASYGFFGDIGGSNGMFVDELSVDF